MDQEVSSAIFSFSPIVILSLLSPLPSPLPSLPLLSSQSLSSSHMASPFPSPLTASSLVLLSLSSPFAAFLFIFTLFFSPFSLLLLLHSLFFFSLFSPLVASLYIYLYSHCFSPLCLMAREWKDDTCSPPGCVREVLLCQGEHTVQPPPPTPTPTPTHTHTHTHTHTSMCSR